MAYQCQISMSNVKCQNVMACQMSNVKCQCQMSIVKCQIYNSKSEDLLRYHAVELVKSQ